MPKRSYGVLREAASSGFWISTYSPYGYKKVQVQDGAKKRPKLDLDPPADGVVRRIFPRGPAGGQHPGYHQGPEQGGTRQPPAGPLDEDHHPPDSHQHDLRLEPWSGQPGPRITYRRCGVEDAFPAIVSHEDFQRVGRHPGVQGPQQGPSPPRRQPLTAHEAKSGQSPTTSATPCEARPWRVRHPRLNSKRFERMIIDQIRENILTESNIRELVNEELTSVIREQQEKVEGHRRGAERDTAQAGPAVGGSGDHDLEINDILPRIRSTRSARRSWRSPPMKPGPSCPCEWPGLGDEETIAPT